MASPSGKLTLCYGALFPNINTCLVLSSGGDGGPPRCHRMRGKISMADAQWVADNRGDEGDRASGLVTVDLA